MSNIQSKILALIISTSAMYLPVHAADLWTIGQRLNATQITALGPLPTVQIGKQSIKILPGTGTNPQGFPLTWVVDSTGRVGQTLHEVTIPGLPTEKIKALAQVIQKAVAVKYYEDMPLTLLRYENLQDAAEAVEQIKKEVPKANASVQISYQLPKPM